MIDQNKQAVDIKGYRTLSPAEKLAMNHLKTREADLLVDLESVAAMPGANYRSTQLAKQHIQEAFMWAIRAIARPNGE